MKEDKGSGVVTVRLFGFLRALRKERGLPVCFERVVPREGKSGFEIAAELELPEEKIEAVFRNGQVQGLDQKVFPGDRVAFVPPGTPGPYRVLLGMVGGQKGPEP
jgi:molybdopterin converting factor small subunit